MTTNFNRLIYDPCFVNKDLQQQKGVYGWIMDKQRFNLPANLQQRHNIKGILQNNPVQTLDKGHVDVVTRENELFGLTRTLSRCPHRKYNPHHQCPNANCHLVHRPGHCEKCVKQQDTHVNKRTPNPLINYHKKVSYKTCNSDKCF
jgi:hypothetical protein